MTPFLYAPVEGTPRWMSVSLTGLRFLLAAFFLLVAAKNLAGDAAMAADFERWGYPGWFRTVTAAVQVAGALLLVDARVAFWGAGVLACVLVGAVATHLRHDPPATAASPAVFLGLVAALLGAYRPPMLR